MATRSARHPARWATRKMRGPHLEARSTTMPVVSPPPPVPQRDHSLFGGYPRANLEPTAYKRVDANTPAILSHSRRRSPSLSRRSQRPPEPSDWARDDLKHADFKQLLRSWTSPRRAAPLAPSPPINHGNVSSAAVPGAVHPSASRKRLDDLDTPVRARLDSWTPSRRILSQSSRRAVVSPPPLAVRPSGSRKGTPVEDTYELLGADGEYEDAVHESKDVKDADKDEEETYERDDDSDEDENDHGEESEVTIPEASSRHDSSMSFGTNGCSVLHVFQNLADLRKHSSTIQSWCKTHPLEDKVYEIRDLQDGNIRMNRMSSMKTSMTTKAGTLADDGKRVHPATSHEDKTRTGTVPDSSNVIQGNAAHPSKNHQLHRLISGAEFDAMTKRQARFCWAGSGPLHYIYQRIHAFGQRMATWEPSDADIFTFAQDTEEVRHASLTIGGLQIVHTHYTNVSDLLLDFDLPVCRVAMDEYGRCYISWQAIHAILSGYMNVPWFLRDKNYRDVYLDSIEAARQPGMGLGKLAYIEYRINRSAKRLEKYVNRGFVPVFADSCRPATATWVQNMLDFEYGSEEWASAAVKLAL